MIETAKEQLKCITTNCNAIINKGDYYLLNSKGEIFCEDCYLAGDEE